MTFPKIDGRTYAVDGDGVVLAYIERNEIGTHGHYRGWTHYAFCPESGEILWTGLSAAVAYPGQGRRPSERWTDAPQVFRNVKEFQEYYERDERR